jgi:hypothetical protein
MRHILIALSYVENRRIWVWTSHRRVKEFHKIESLRLTVKLKYRVFCVAPADVAAMQTGTTLS